MPTAPAASRTVDVMLRWHDGRTTAHAYDVDRDGPLSLELTHGRGSAVGHFRFSRMRDGVFEFRQVH